MAIDIVTAEELPELLRLSPSRILLLARRGDIPSFRIDGRVRFDAQAIQEWIQALNDPLRRRPPRLINESNEQEKPPK